MSLHTANFVCEWNPTGSAWVDITAFVLSVDGDFQTTGQGNGIGFGDSSTASAKVTIDPNASGGPLDVSVWSYVPVRVTFTIDANTAKGAAGVILDMEQDIETVTFTVVGFKQLISTTRVYSQLFLYRPIATKTTALSIEDPANGSYAAGLLNWILWQAGGRPYEQSATYTSATFYYSLAQAPIAPKYTWASGEDAWAEALRLVKAAGGQLYQRPDGVIAYVSPLTIAGGASVVTLTNDDYTTATRRGTARDVVSSFACTFLPRVQGGMQEIINDTTARVVDAGATNTIELQLSQPISLLETASGGGTQLIADAISATSYDGAQIAQGTGYTHTLSITAQRVVLTITNVSSQPFVIEKLILRGTPIIPGELGTVTIGSGNPTQTIEQSPYIQTRGHALRLARMALAFYGTARPIITLSGLLYNPTLQVGMAGTLTVSEWSITAQPFVILSVKHKETGTESELDVIVTSGLPALVDYFLIQTASQAGLTKKIGY